MNDSNTQIPDTAEPLVLIATDWRVEIHLRQDEDRIATLLAYAGREGAIPERATHQGPFQGLDQAIGARRAITQQLQRQGFTYQPAVNPLWSLHAQRDINAMRDTKSGSTADYRFDPKDVFLDW